MLSWSSSMCSSLSPCLQLALSAGGASGGPTSSAPTGGSPSGLFGFGSIGGNSTSSSRRWPVDLEIEAREVMLAACQLALGGYSTTQEVSASGRL